MKKFLLSLALFAGLSAYAADVPLTGSGTETDPYVIATVEDLCNAYLGVNTSGCEVFFKQTADIDMAGVTEYHAIAGYNGTYAAIIHYEGGNHLIKNFAPNNVPWAETANTDFYYCTSVFGVASGSISNLGVVDAKCETDHGAGILGAYAGHSAATSLELENVFVTGEVVATGGYTGGMFGTTGNEVTMVNCFANVTVSGTKFPAGLIGRASNDITLENVYVSGTVAGPDAYLVMGTNKTPVYDGSNVIAFNSGAAEALAAAIEVNDKDVVVATAENAAELIAEVKEWKGFSATQSVEGYPTLAAFEEGTKDRPYEIATVKDLCNAYSIVNTSEAGPFYFVQTADIDMAGVKEWHALLGYNGTYAASVNYDGQNHVIKNFAPEAPAWAGSLSETNQYYCASVFGVAAGVIKNLGVVNAYCVSNHGTGIIAAYGGHGTAGTLTMENVFVTGTVNGTGKYAGGMLGCTANEVTMTNCYANVQLISTDAATNKNGGIAGRVGANVILENVYVAGTVPAEAALVTNGGGTLEVDGVVAFNTGSKTVAAQSADDIVLANSGIAEAAGIVAVQEWEAYSDTKYVSAYPALAKFNYGAPATDVTTVKGTKDLATNSPVKVGYDLTVGYANGNNVFAVDAVGDFIQLYGKNSLKAGNVVPAAWVGTYKLYSGTTPEIIFNTLPAAKEGTFTPKEVAAGSINTNMVNSVVLVKNVAFAEATPATKVNFTGKVGDIELAFRNNYTLESRDAGLYDVTVVVSVYQGKVQLYVTEYAEAAAKGDGTAQNPFVISSVSDLTLAYKRVAANPNGMTYFVQTADIDMAGVKEWHAINGFNGTYTAAINYDGQNHLIKNFAPEVTAPDAAKDNYYMGTIFGVLTGTVKNLGIVDANVVNGQQGGGFLAAYAGHGDAASIAPFTYIENVFVTGTYDASANANYIGGLVGTTGSSIEITNCFVNADIKAQNNVAGLVGRLRHDLAVTHSYVAGTVAGTGANVALAISSDKTPDVIVDGVYAFNTGAEKAVVGAKVDEDVVVATTEAEVKAAISKINYWKAYSKTDKVYGLPALDGFGYSVEKIVANSVKSTIELEAKTVFTVDYELTVGFVSGSNAFAVDAAGDFIQLYRKEGLDLKVGDKIPAGWEGTYDVYYDVPEIVVTTLPEVTEGTFEAAEVAAEDVNEELVNAVVVIKGVVLAEATPATKDNFTGKVGDVELNFRNNYELESVEAGTYDITVVVSIFKGNVQLYVVNYVKDETTGLEGIEAAGVDAVYYNLQGVEVANPESGIYIVRRGNKVTKEVIRK